MAQTTNIGLYKLGAQSKLKDFPTLFNDDMDIIDSAVGGLDSSTVKVNSRVAIDRNTSSSLVDCNTVDTTGMYRIINTTANSPFLYGVLFHLMSNDYKSDIAYGPLFEGYAVCGGYTDLMELFLERLHIKSYKVSSNDHIWNVIQMGGSWYHLDLTWDDPVADDGNNYLEHSFFLIDTKKLLELEKTQHSFDQSVYLEVATN